MLNYCPVIFNSLSVIKSLEMIYLKRSIISEFKHSISNYMYLELNPRKYQSISNE